MGDPEPSPSLQCVGTGFSFSTFGDGESAGGISPRSRRSAGKAGLRAVSQRRSRTASRGKLGLRRRPKTVVSFPKRVESTLNKTIRLQQEYGVDTRPPGSLGLPRNARLRTNAVFSSYDLHDDPVFGLGVPPEEVLQNVRRAMMHRVGVRRGRVRSPSPPPATAPELRDAVVGIDQWFRTRQKLLPPGTSARSERASRASRVRRVFGSLLREGSKRVAVRDVAAAMQSLGMNVSEETVQDHLRGVDPILGARSTIDSQTFQAAFAARDSEWTALAASRRAQEEAAEEVPLQRAGSQRMQLERTPSRRAPLQRTMSQRRGRADPGPPGLPFELWVPAYNRRKKMQGVISRGPAYIAELQRQDNLKNSRKPWDSPPADSEFGFEFRPESKAGSPPSWSPPTMPLRPQFDLKSRARNHARKRERRGGSHLRKTWSYVLNQRARASARRELAHKMRSESAMQKEGQVPSGG